jgi:ATP-dependent phosphofructokinase / diphosphate-dependent phosphofructokinase
MKRKRIGLLTSGGAFPGLNTLIRGVVRAAENLNWEVIGFLDGFEDMLAHGNSVVLDKRATDGIIPLGGHDARRRGKGPFHREDGNEERTTVNPEVIADAKRVLDIYRIEGLIVVGCDSLLTFAQQLVRAGFPLVGVPNTIDDYLQETAMTFSFDHGVIRVVHALNRLRKTANSHNCVIVLEVTGRDAAWIAIHGGIAGGADVILIPEIPFDFDKVARVVRLRATKGALSTMIVVGEGALPNNDCLSCGKSGRAEFRLESITEVVAREVKARTGKETGTFAVFPLHRGHTPTALNRILGTRFAFKAMSLIGEGKFGRMVIYQNYQVLDVPIIAAGCRLRCIHPNSKIIETARKVKISFGD